MLKELIQRLLESRTTPAQAVHAVRRDDATATVITNGSLHYIAPGDGFITVNSTTQTDGGCAIGITGGDISYCVRTFSSVAGWTQSVSAPVTKGEKISLSLYNLKDTAVIFCNAFGGGYNILIWRALSCLKPLSNFSRKVFSRAKRRGSVTSHTAGATLLRSRSLLARLLHTWHHRMASSLLQVPHVQPLTSLFKVLTCGSTWHALKNKSLQVTSHCQKDSKLTSLFLEITSKATQRNSSLQSVQVSITTGGASC